MTTDFLSHCWVELDIFSSLLSLGLDRKRTNGSMYQSLSPVGRIKSHRDRHYEFPLFSPFFLSFFLFFSISRGSDGFGQAFKTLGWGGERKAEREGGGVKSQSPTRKGGKGSVTSFPFFPPSVVSPIWRLEHERW